MSSFGAIPPDNFKWQIGKTAATIKFVKEASIFLIGQPMIARNRMLEKFIIDLKSGEKELTEFMTIEEFMNQEHIACLG